MKIYQVDAFTDRIFTGNPEGVCVIDSSVDEQLMRNIAAEMNLSETAFLRPKGGEFDLRWFAPTREVDLCGHATLASAHILWETGILSKDRLARFHMKSGLLIARRANEYIELDFPREEEQACPLPDEIASALNVEFK